MSRLLVVGGISSVHGIARRLGAELTLVKTAASQTMLDSDEYARIIDVSEFEDRDRAVKEVVAAVGTTRFDGMLCLHDDAIELGARIAEQLRLTFPSPDVVHRTVDKSAMRDRLDAAGLGSVAHGVVVDGRVEWRIAATTSELVVKPADGRASRGVTFHRSVDDLLAWLAARPGEAEGYVVEERKRGREFSVETLIVHTGDVWHGVTAKTTTGAVESGHLHPAPLTDREHARVVDTVIACLVALGVDRGLLHTEVILGDDGAAHIVETHLRGGGDGILDLVRTATGLDLAELYVRDVVVGLDRIPDAREFGYASSQFAFPTESGVLTGWEGVEQARALPGVDAVTTLLTAGQRVSADVTSSYGRSVCALAHADDPATAVVRARLAAQRPRATLESGRW